ncbi:MAG: DinB family protein [Phycisphaerales bacterium]|nr:DinB family protein [Phycisphaerales bacterium]
MQTTGQPSNQPTDPASVLIAHDRWANERLYAACQALTAELFNQPFEMGTGSLSSNLLHNLGAMHGWTDVLNQTPSRPRLEEQSCTLGQIIELHDPTSSAFEQAALAKPFDTVITRERGDQTYTFTAGGILTHVMTHSMHHRAQCYNMLRQLGIKDQPMSSIMEWMITTHG